MNLRQVQLLEAVRTRGSATVEELAAHFDVALQTMRRDLQLLTDNGLVARYHGGVRLEASTTENIAYRQRESLNVEGKQRIARAVAAEVPEGCSLVMNIGTTVEAIARELIHHQNLRVITNNLNVASILAANPSCEILVAGGHLRSRDKAVIGETVVDFIRQFRVDIALIGISGIEADGTLCDFDLREVKVANAIMEQSRQVWLAADSTKFNRPAMVKLARLDQLDRLFTDSLPPDPFPALIEKAKVELVVV